MDIDDLLLLLLDLEDYFGGVNFGREIQIRGGDATDRQDRGRDDPPFLAQNVVEGAEINGVGGLFGRNVSLLGHREKRLQNPLRHSNGVLRHHHDARVAPIGNRPGIDSEIGLLAAKVAGDGNF